MNDSEKEMDDKYRNAHRIESNRTEIEQSIEEKRKCQSAKEMAQIAVVFHNSAIPEIINNNDFEHLEKYSMFVNVCTM